LFPDGLPRGARSFPTRRSSDLLSQNSLAAAEGTDPNCVAEHHHTILAPLFLVRGERSAQFRLRAKDVKETGRHGPAIHLLRFVADRKSTRLNSSHDQTSYAVFC